MKKDEKTEKNDQRKKQFGVCYHCGKKGKSKDCKEKKVHNEKKNEKTEKAVDGD